MAVAIINPISIPRLRQGKLVGIMTFEDAEKVTVNKRAMTLVQDVMTRRMISVKPDDSLEDALRELLDRDIGRLPVVDENDPAKLIGLLTKYDIMRTHARLSLERQGSYNI